MTPASRRRGFFLEIAEGLYWFLVVDVMIALSATPTVVVWLLLQPGPLSPVLFVLAALPLLPAATAALHAVHRWRAEPEGELEPARQYLRGYRATVLESLRVGGPLLALLALVSLQLASWEPAGAGALRATLLVLGGLSLLILLRGLSIVSRFTFRVRDVYRLTVFTLLTRPLSTLALLSLGVLTLGILLVVGEFLLPVAASLLALALWASERPVAQLITEQFVAAPGGAESDATAVVAASADAEAPRTQR
ncbi:hypothetical protein [Brachybacterium sp. YJGR34]|uniref:hypothetical protein n=1 Tax=Brachybacterium sp. YJGR34 TaxID=2059911 RepID=UPI0018E5C995|nr:hypothetical protein [Brachybacterium sp. YJGR34]